MSNRESLCAARDEAATWLESFREFANPRTAEERWEYLDQAAVHVERLLVVAEADGSLIAVRDSLIRERDGRKFLNLAREDDIVAALERSENDWAFLYNLHSNVPLAPEVRKALAAANLKLIRAGQ